MEFKIEVDTSKLKNLGVEGTLKLTIGLFNMANAIRDEVKSLTPVGVSHQLQKSITFIPQGLDMSPRPSYFITSIGCKYSLPAFLGSRPHFPPVEALMEWVKLRNFAPSIKSIKRKAWLLAITISKKGTRDKIWIWDSVYNKYKNKVKDYIKI